MRTDSLSWDSQDSKSEQAHQSVAQSPNAIRWRRSAVNFDTRKDLREISHPNGILNGITFYEWNEPTLDRILPAFAATNRQSRSNVAQMSLKCRSNVAPTRFKRRSNVVQTKLKCRSNEAQMSLKRSSNVPEMSLKCRRNLTQMSLNCRSNVAETRLKCSSNAAQMSLKCR
jgi:hypothetical protein